MSQESTLIKWGDPRHIAAMRVLDAMHEYFKLRPTGGAVQWIEDADGRVVIFTRGEYRNMLMQSIDNERPTQSFELEDPATKENGEGS